MFHPVFLFLNIGSSEMILIMFVALLLFGGEKLPQIAKGLGKGIRDFKDASEGVKRELNNQINNFEEKANTPAVMPEVDPNLPVVANTTPLADPFAPQVIAEHETHLLTEHHTDVNEAADMQHAVAPAGESHADLSHLINSTQSEITQTAENHISITHVSDDAKGAEQPVKIVKE